VAEEEGGERGACIGGNAKVRHRASIPSALFRGRLAEFKLPDGSPSAVARVTLWSLSRKRRIHKVAVETLQ
jgi:hypothetical protein